MIDFPGIKAVLGAYRSTESHVTAAQMQAAWAEYEALRAFYEATFRVPIKQHDRTPDEQARVQAFTTAYVELQEAIKHG